MPEWSLSDIPGSVVLRAQEDADFALRLLHPESRQEALSHPDLDLSDEQMQEISPILDQIAELSFHDAVEMLWRQGGITMK